MTTTALADIRSFSFGTDRLEHPVDVLGRARFRAPLERSSVRVTRSSDLTAAIPFGGTSILFNQPTWIGSRDMGYWEQIAPQAITKTLQEADIRFLQNHNPDLLLARTNPVMRAAGTSTLTLTPAMTGLITDADMAPVSYAQDLAILLERGDISQMSFAFEPLEWVREQRDDGSQLITITALRLYDVSVVTYPAYEETDAGLRAAAFDAMCRQSGLAPSAVLRGFANGGQMPDADLIIPGQNGATQRADRSTTAVAPGARTQKRAGLIVSTRSLNGWTYSDLWDLLDDAIVDECSTPEFNAYWYVGVFDISDEWFVWWDRRPGNDCPKYFQAPYTVTVDGVVTLGESFEVIIKTTYLPAAAEANEPVNEPAMGDAPDPEGGEYSAPAPPALRHLELRTAEIANAFEAG